MAKGADYKQLKTEITGMIKLLSGDWKVLELGLGPAFWNDERWYSAVYSESGDRNVLMVSGKGRTKAEALANVLENWRKGQSEPYAPAAGGVGELRLKLAVRGETGALQPAACAV